MKLWLLYQDTNTDGDYYDSCLVVAATEDNARQMYPHNKPEYYWSNNSWRYTYSGQEYADNGTEWASPEDVVVEYVGETYKTKPEVLLSSFNPAMEVCYLK